MSWQILAAKCLKTEAEKVRACLERGDLAAARKQVGMLVGRNTESLTGTQIVKAAVETVAENTSDGVIAPLFWMILGGPVAGFVYKAINTMTAEKPAGSKSWQCVHAEGNLLAGFPHMFYESNPHIIVRFLRRCAGEE